MVKTLPFGDITVPSPGFGAMGLSFALGSNLSLEEAEPVLLKALELGCTFWDTAVSLHFFQLMPQVANIEHTGDLSSGCE
jgi:aryl-alcohol dehydrogenase-like predicted oxidoreductase